MPNVGTLRNFRLALACTIEYSQYHLNLQGVPASATLTTKKTAVLSAMNNTMNRVNGVFERDLSVRMTFIGTNDSIIFIDSDNLDNSNQNNALINQIQGVIDGAIGNANYDIGHVFSTGGGGVASLGSVCVNTSKARGVTGRGAPVGDAFDIDFVAHEIGHQFGATHTFNGTTGSCSGGNRTDATAVEPGSGTTIMAYAGICAPQNVQDNSNDYFHALSIDNMWTHIQNVATCGNTSSTNNAAPTANAGADYFIPKSTPFVLKGQGTDADGNSSLTYNWEQIDNEVNFPIPPLTTNTGGAMFRSLPSKVSPNRYMPALPTIIAGNTSSQWEVLPSVVRTMNFSLVVRDNNVGGGASNRDDMQVSVADIVPFTVTSQNSAVIWNAGETKIITWNKGTTDSAPVNCLNVRIKLSTDGGLTFPTVLVENTPNDGSHNIIVPDQITSNARIMVEAADNIFYNVNSTNFTITSTSPTFTLTNNSQTQVVCNSGNNSVSYTIDVDFVNSFSGSVNFSATNLPGSSTATFNPTSLGADGSTIMTINNLNGANTQDYIINIAGTATSPSLSQNTDVFLKVVGNSFSNITLIAPIQASTEIDLKPIFSWGADSNAISYDIQIATDSSFSNIIHTGNTVANSYHLVTPLQPFTTYYWNVKPKNTCGDGPLSSVGNFQTICILCPSSGNTTYETSTTLVQFNTIDNASAKPSGYSDYTAISTTVKTNSSYNLTVNNNTDSSASNQYTTKTIVWIDWNNNCSFNDAGEMYDLGTVTGSADGVTSLSPLSITVPAGATAGTTIMRVSTKFASDGDPTSCEAGFDGEVEDYTLVVEDPTASVVDFNFNNFSLYPNPSNGKFNVNFEVVNTDKVSIQLYDMRGRVIEDKKYLNTANVFSEEVIFNKISSGLYILKIKNGGKQTTRKVVIE